MLKPPRHFYGEQIETPRKPKSEAFFFLLALLSPLSGLIAYTLW